MIAAALVAVIISLNPGAPKDAPNLVGEPATLRNGKVVTANRLGDGKPLITKSMFVALGVPSEGENINGPSVIRVPDWIPENERPDASANYYMYFARHGRDQIGDYIRMAWAQHIEGPWQLFNIGKDVVPGKRGVLDLGAEGTIQVGPSEYLTYSVGSPEVIVDHDRRRIIMYFHAVRSNREAAAFVSTSPFGLDFNGSIESVGDGHGIRPTPLGGSYFRTFEYRGRMYAFSNSGRLHRAPPTGDTEYPDGIWGQRWETIDGPLRRAHDDADDGDGDALERAGNPRHFAVVKAYDELWVFFTRRDDAPERILLSRIDPGEEDWRDWRATFPPITILAPELEWEGADLPITASSSGKAINQRAIRDPYVLIDADGGWYLFYTGRGEEAIGVARLVVSEP